MATEGPVLRPGRPADPGQPATAAPVGSSVDVPPPHSPAAVSSPSELPAEAIVETGSSDSGTDHQGGAEVEDTETPDEAQRGAAESRQRRLRRLLRQCERVNLLDFNALALAGWPDNYILSAARQRRDIWLLSAIIAALVFLSGLTGFVPAWIAGGGFGAFVVILLAGIPMIRRLYSARASYLELLLQRQQLLREARKHVARLEGEVGLIWQCNELAEFNPALSSPRFSALKHLSEKRRLASSLSKREHVRLYLIFMLEAEKAYQRMQSAYFEGHRKAIDRGWESVAKAVTDPDNNVSAQGTSVLASAAPRGDGEPEQGA